MSYDKVAVLEPLGELMTSYKFPKRHVEDVFAELKSARPVHQVSLGTASIHDRRES